MVFNLKPLNAYKPAVDKRGLYFSAGLVWMVAGGMLIRLASRWLRTTSVSNSMLLLTTGITLAAGIDFLGFSSLAGKNIRRIRAMVGERICLFAFQEWKSYPLVLFMIALGVYLRVYAPIPKPLLVLLYIGIGGGLVSSSLHYFVQVIER